MSQARLELKSFATSLYRARVDKGWSQSELARRIWGSIKDARGYDVARNRDLISSYERGRSAPSRENLEQLATALGLTPEQLAPDLAAPDVEKSMPAISMTMVEGRPDKVVLQVNKITTLGVAAKVIALLSEDEEKVRPGE